ncbi:Haloacid dehalogenase-like hydrolase (HAD) superfamily protein [Raphanus sativus]|nr:Haloacid dehalogenase-like hydrolase (HAD) superfamily protein [Raphanus sativus]
MVYHGFVEKPNQRSRRRRNLHQRQQSRCSAVAVAAPGSIFTPLNMSVFTFHNRLLRCVSRLFRLSTKGSAKPSHRATVEQGYKKIKKQDHHHQLPLRKRHDKKRTIILDLDETLVHASMEPPLRVNVDFTVRIKIEGVVTPMYVVKRPGVTEFLDRIGKKYRVAVFTAAAVQRLVHGNVREICQDLSLVARRDLGSVLLVDDNPFSYSLQPYNGVHIKPFVDDMEDQELKKLADFFDGCYQYEDLRDAAAERLYKYNKVI